MMWLKGLWRLFKKNYRKLFKLVAVSLLLLAILWLGQIFQIKKIICTNNGNQCDQEFLLEINKLTSTNILFFQSKELQNRLEKIQPIKNLSTHFKPLNTIVVNIETESQHLIINYSLVTEYPSLSFNSQPVSSDSANFFVKPSTEIQTFITGTPLTSFKLWPNGKVAPVESLPSKIYYLFKQKSEAENLKEVFTLLDLVEKYTVIDNVYILGNTVFLSRASQPDIITSVSYNEASINEALQSLGFLTTMKKDPKVIDLRYKNPIIR